MLTNLVIFGAVLIAVLIIGGTYYSFSQEESARRELAESEAMGTNRPATLHPYVHLDTCMGSGACVDACPVSVLGRIGGVTQLVNAGECIGYGRCHNACPVNAISLVFGTAQRGVDIPLLRDGYESNVDGILIAGELGGMGLIRNAMQQGGTAARTVATALKRPHAQALQGEGVDLIIIGAGPAGIAAALECASNKTSYVLLEQYTFGGSIAQFPRRKVVLTDKVKLPIVGDFGKPVMIKEEVIAEFERILLKASITVRDQERVTEIKGSLGNFQVKTESEGGQTLSYRGRTVLLAVGRRGTPRVLGVPGETLPHVVYRLVDPEQYRHRRVLCVGGGDSAIEAAVSLAETAGTTVHLSYRGKALFRVKKQNQKNFTEAVAKGSLTVHFETNVREITSEIAILQHDDGSSKTLRIDDVLVNVGGVLPTEFLASVGVEMETRHGEAKRHGERPGDQSGSRGGA